MSAAARAAEHAAGSGHGAIGHGLYTISFDVGRNDVETAVAAGGGVARQRAGCESTTAPDRTGFRLFKCAPGDDCSLLPACRSQRGRSDEGTRAHRLRGACLDQTSG
jgi:hypothetical protein